MTTDQTILFALLGLVFVFLIWGRWRYDLVAFVALLALVVLGVVPVDRAFAGFGHPATIIIAFVLIISRGLTNSGAIELIARFVVSGTRKLGAHIAIMSTLTAALSAVMNNVAALALLMPVDIQAAEKAGRSPSQSLMPISFASILGGMITLIGTPPNIIIAGYRGDALGEPYRMFDFAPVGLACAVSGIIFITLVGWRLLPASARQGAGEDGLFELANYIAELRVREGSKIIGKRVRELDEQAAAHDVEVLGLIREGQRKPGLARAVAIEPGDVLILEADPDSLDEVLGTFGLEYIGTGEGLLKDDDLELIEVVVPESSALAGLTAGELRLVYRYGVALVGVAREGKRFREAVRRLPIQAGDVLLLLGGDERLTDASAHLRLLPLRDRGKRVIQRDKAWQSVGIFALAIGLASLGWLNLTVALGCVVALMALLNIVPLREIYTSIEWPVIVLLGSMIPIGVALQDTGGTALIAGAIVGLAEGYSPVVVLTLLIVATMMLSDVMNNTATAVIAAPIGIDMANRLGVNPDPFLMGVAVAASCAFLTPIGHKNNTLILGPGGYRFGDYWRMGLPLEILIIVVSVPTILAVWPL